MTAFRCVPLRRLVTINDDVLAEGTAEDLAIHYVDIGAVGTGCLKSRPEAMVFANAPSRARRVLRPGDVLVSTVRTYLRSVWRVLGEADGMLVASTGFAQLRAASLLDRYLGWATQGDAFINEVEARSVGVSYPAITATKLAEIPLSVPSRAEQQRIANFLDAETERIDTIIAEYERQINLVEEEWERERLRATGWDGAPFATVMLKRCFSESHYGIGTSTADVGEVAVLGMGNLVGGEVVGTPGGFVDEVEPHLLLREGDLLFNRTNSLAHVGKTALVRSTDPKTTCASYVVIFRTNDRADAEFLNFSLNSLPMRSLASAAAIPSIGQANLNPTRYGQLVIPLPDRRTQQRVAEELREHRRRTDALTGEMRAQIDHITEYRQALITMAVTEGVEACEAVAS